MTHVAVVGGGITGLGAARLLVRRGYQVTVVEATRRWGGKLTPVVIDDVRLDGGAESVLARRPEAVDLIKDLGLGDRLVHPTGAKPRLLIDGASRPAAAVAARRADRARGPPGNPVCDRDSGSRPANRTARPPHLIMMWPSATTSTSGSAPR